MKKQTTNKRPVGRPKKEVVQTNNEIEQSLYFNERDFQNYGKFVPFIVNYGLANNDAGVRVNEYSRHDLVNQSRHYVANLGEVKAGMQRLADFTVGNAMVPMYSGTNQIWANEIKNNWLNDTLNNLTRLGIVCDWQTLWQTVLKIVLEDGDVLLIPYRDRYGTPKIDIIEGHRICNRQGTDTIKGGQFDGFKVEDGVIYNQYGTVKGYCIMTDDEKDDYTISTANSFLIYSPFSFAKGRGLPILASSARNARNLMDYQHYIPQIVKMEAAIQLIETNTEGRAPMSRTAFGAFNSAVSNPNNTSLEPLSQNAVTEYTQAGLRYLKPNGKLESFNSSRPTHEVQTYYTTTQKELLSNLFPHQLLLSPETVGGPGARGIKEVLVATINTHRAMIEKAALLVLRYVLSVGMSNTNLQETFDFTTNYEEDFTKWTFTKAPELVIDAGQERAADLNDLRMGIKSPDEVVAKEGRSYDDVLRDIYNSATKKAKIMEQFIKENPSMEKYAPQMFGLTETVVDKYEANIPKPIETQANIKPVNK